MGNLQLLMTVSVLMSIACLFAALWLNDEEGAT
jgi:hypothetical protein